MRWMVVSILLLTLFLTTEGRAWAYIDPNTGGLLWQILAPLVSVALGAMVYLRKTLAQVLSTQFAKPSSSWLVPLVAVAAAAVNIILLNIGAHGVFLPFLVSVVATAEFSGLVESLAALVMSSICLSWWFLKPYGSIAIASPGDRRRFVLFLVSALACVLICKARAISQDLQKRKQLSGVSR